MIHYVSNRPDVYISVAGIMGGECSKMHKSFLTCNKDFKSCVHILCEDITLKIQTSVFKSAKRITYTF